MAKTFNVVIIDDEAPAREVIKNYLKEYNHVTIKAECENGFEGIKAIQEYKPDIIFLDIQMPKITGFEMLELLEEKPVIVFSTADDSGQNKFATCIKVCYIQIHETRPIIRSNYCWEIYDSCPRLR